MKPTAHSQSVSTDSDQHAENVVMTSEERQRLADEIEQRIWPIIHPATRDDVNLGQLRVNILDALNAALLAV